MRQDAAHCHLMNSIVETIVAEKGKEKMAVVRIADGVEHVELSLSIEPEAQLTVVCIHTAENAKLSVTGKSEVMEGGTLRWQNILLGSGTIDLQLVSHVMGADATSAVDCCFFGRETDRMTMNVRNVFDAPRGSGEILMRGIAEGRAHGSLKGCIEIGLNGGGTNTYLTQEALMLDATAKVDAVPQLEIKTNDVKASHSASVARVTEEDLFYFGSRGIDPAIARLMFVKGFLGTVIDRIADAALREDLFLSLDHRLAGE